MSESLVETLSALTTEELQKVLAQVGAAKLESERAAKVESLSKLVEEKFGSRVREAIEDREVKVSFTLKGNALFTVSVEPSEVTSNPAQLSDVKLEITKVKTKPEDSELEYSLKYILNEPFEADVKSLEDVSSNVVDLVEEVEMELNGLWDELDQFVEENTPPEESAALSANELWENLAN